jgi:hypothetical protein
MAASVLGAVAGLGMVGIASRRFRPPQQTALRPLMTHLPGAGLRFR